MKKWLIALLTLLALSLSVAFAAEANDITEDCKFKVCSSGRKYTLMTDKKYTSYWESNKIKTPWIAITAPEGKPIAGLYVCFGNMPESWEIQTSDDGKDWFTAVPGDTRFLHAYVALPQPAQHVRLAVTSEKKTALRINDLFVLSEGDLPDWVQVWQPTEEKADILFLSTHPDDELIFFGGAIPTYAVEQQRKVVVAYFSRSNTTRSSELLNGLWHMGVRTYPVIGNFKDSYAKNLKAAYKSAGGKGKVNEWIVGLYRQYKPEVVVTQDTNGEYGHKQHMMIADAAQNCIALAANEDEFTASTIAYGTWQVKKLYLHLYPENQITFDWTVPLKSMNGATGIELAEEAYTLHKTQASSGMSVTETGTKYDNRVFGLAFTTVGEDVRKDDFLENIYDAPGSYDAAANNVEATPAPTEVPAYMAHMPALNAKGFLDEGEYLYSSEDEGLWIYVSQTSKVIIQRKYDATQPLTWFEADLYGDLDAGEMLRTVQNDPEKMGKVRVDATETAKKHNVVFAMNTDYYTYRVAVNNNRHTGIVIRDGRILYDDPYTEKQVTNSMFPNLDMLAFMPDGSLKVYHSWEKTAQEFIDEGVQTVYSFGPYLLLDGKVSERAYANNENKNPRCAIGMVEPGHYVAIMCEGRLKRSAGVTISYLAKMMRAKGCQVAFNMDGGQTAVMVFMGKQLNQIGAYDGGKTNSRPTSEVLGFGTSEQVGTYEVQ
ncbi:MAG: phosphodiester glycosidase family protein [Christensenellales bacterium]|nr:phosphodiester glycosidase family protein [Christensenellales bacterium]